MTFKECELKSENYESRFKFLHAFAPSYVNVIQMDKGHVTEFQVTRYQC